ncbi:hypothetical protein QOL99_13785 [Deinococcus sp. MIMF12]|uniref:Uncharacterized protein n=1 Tax=Deinococcus rhizophilus TaxID=3049544 RepID=A0ABT7JJH9_9DEIO|nr:hypothetical protein [Deinococcus rhizophilus]MDL2345211.1 hypothetical protein [Deinococcus rhizophilus]
MPTKDGINQVKPLLHVHVSKGGVRVPMVEAVPAAPRARMPGSHVRPAAQAGSKKPKRVKAPVLTALPPGEETPGLSRSTHVQQVQFSPGGIWIPVAVMEAYLEMVSAVLPDPSFLPDARDVDQLATFFQPAVNEVEDLWQVLHALEAGMVAGACAFHWRAQVQGKVEAISQALTRAGRLPRHSRPERAVSLPWRALAEWALEHHLLESLSSKRTYMAGFRALRAHDVWSESLQHARQLVYMDAQRRLGAGAFQQEMGRMVQRLRTLELLVADRKPAPLEVSTRVALIRKGPDRRLAPEDRLAIEPSRLGVPQVVLQTYLDFLVPQFCTFDPPLEAVDEIRAYLAPAKPELVQLWRLMRDMEKDLLAGKFMLNYRQPFTSYVVAVTYALTEVEFLPPEVTEALKGQRPTLPWGQMACWLLDWEVQGAARKSGRDGKVLLARVRASPLWARQHREVVRLLQADAVRQLQAGGLTKAMEPIVMALIRAGATS